MSASSLKITPFRAISNTLLHIFVVYMGGFKGGGGWNRRTPPLSEVNHQNYKYK